MDSYLRLVQYSLFSLSPLGVFGSFALSNRLGNNIPLFLFLFIGGIVCFFLGLALNSFRKSGWFPALGILVFSTVLLGGLASASIHRSGKIALVSLGLSAAIELFVYVEFHFSRRWLSERLSKQGSRVDGTLTDIVRLGKPSAADGLLERVDLKFDVTTACARDFSTIVSVRLSGSAISALKKGQVRELLFDTLKPAYAVFAPPSKK